MDYTEALRERLCAFAERKCSLDDMIEFIAGLPYSERGDVRLDGHRSVRRGIGEIILCQGKSPSQLQDIAALLRERPGNTLFSRMTFEQAEIVRGELTEMVYHPLPRMGVLQIGESKSRGTSIAVVSAGAGDVPVAEEAALVASFAGCRVERYFDVGVAGLHRLLDVLPDLRKADAIIVVAGMDGALPSVVSGLVGSLVIAVPTSVGYGASFGGVAPLLAMLNACSSGVVVVNIDNGVGAGVAAALASRPGLSRSGETERPDGVGHTFPT